MNESSCTKYAHIQKKEDYKIFNATPDKNKIVIKTEQGDLILMIDRNITLVMAMDLIKVATVRIKQDINKEFEALPIRIIKKG